MSIFADYYASTQDGRQVYAYTLENAHGMRAVILEYGCTIAQLWVPDKQGDLQDVVLGYQTLEEYEKSNAGMGACIGRYANRLLNATFTLNNKTYELPKNEGIHHLHGLFSHQVFQGKIVTRGYGEDLEERLVLTLHSPSGEDGFPGNLKVSVTYELTDTGSLVIDYIVTSDEDTILNLTNHAYFNLDGIHSESIAKHQVYMDAKKICEVDECLCATGNFLDVADTPFDFTQEKEIGQGLKSDHQQIKIAQGYDHNFVLDKQDGALELAATAYSNESGIEMKVYTTQPGLQFYTSNTLSQAGVGKNGKPFCDYQAFCMETQHFPCSPSYEHFPSTILKKDQEYHQTTVYAFQVRI